MCTPSADGMPRGKCPPSWNTVRSSARTMSHSRGISEWTRAEPFTALITGTSMSSKFISSFLPSQ